ncbi:MAG: hypothetical protein MUE37_08300 [Bacteroidales bacterium]|jgi:hypothetical protein|nr:hypothetical protein [Bacteroidales bacterium]
MMTSHIVQLKTVVALLFLSSAITPVYGASDVYFLTYATEDGKTGHSAIAVENYTIHVTDLYMNGIIRHRYDTLKTGTLTYFDFWPEEDHFSIVNVGKDTKARYNRLPGASYNKEITLWYLKNHGVPHIRNYPCDGILVYNTKPFEDYALVHFMDSIIGLNKPFNVRKFNCSDFVLCGASYVTGRKITAREFIPFSFSTTPNRLYRKLSRIAGMEVQVDPGPKVKGLFFKERIIEMIFRAKPATETAVTME